MSSKRLELTKKLLKGQRGGKRKIRELEATEHIEGFVLRSGVRGVFTGGLHLPELLLADDGSNEAVAAFWHDFQELALALHGTPLATVAAKPWARPVKHRRTGRAGRATSRVVGGCWW